MHMHSQTIPVCKFNTVTTYTRLPAGDTCQFAHFILAYRIYERLNNVLRTSKIKSAKLTKLLYTTNARKQYGHLNY